jgi:hypothetical protein
MAQAKSRLKGSIAAGISLVRRFEDEELGGRYATGYGELLPMLFKPRNKTDILLPPSMDKSG